MNTFRFIIIGMAAAAMVAGVGVQAQSGSGSGSSSSSGSGSGGTSSKKGAFDGGGTGKQSDKPFGNSPGPTAPGGTPPSSVPGSGRLEPVTPPLTPPTPNTPPPNLPNEPVRPGENPTEPGNATGVQAPVETDLDTWARIRGNNYEQRTDFMKGMDRIGSRADASITTLKRQRSTHTGDPNAWDAEMKRLDDARAYLQSTSQELAKATSVNWDERKERVEGALERYQAAYERASSLATP